MSNLAFVDDLTPEEAEALLAQTTFAIKKLEMEQNLKPFIIAAWHLLEPGRELIWNWHLDTLCGYLEAVNRREIRRLIINIPPGCMKSLIVSVFYPAWVWLDDPGHKFLCGSNDGTLATRDSLKMRSLVESDWYQERWGIRIEEDEDGFDLELPHIQLHKDQREKTLFMNTSLGHRQSQGILGKVTGKRGDTTIWDDPHDAKQTESDVQRTAITDAYDTGWANRMNDANKSAFILIMQRLHTKDASAHLFAKENQGWVKLAIPMRYDSEIVYDAGKDIGRPDLNDPRTQEGELLFPARFNEESVRTDEVNMGPYGAAGQLQQTPSPKGGGEFRRNWLRYYKKSPFGGNRYIIVDPAGERKPGVKGKRDNTAMGVIEVGADGNTYLIDVYRDRLNLTERTDILFRWHREYQPIAVGYEQYGMQSDIAHIKDEMENTSYRFDIIELGGSMKKEDRIRRLIPKFAAGRIWLPEHLHRTLNDGTTIDIIDKFVEIEYLPFPVAEYDDMFDMLSRIEDEDMKEAIKKPMKKKKRPPMKTRRAKDASVGY